MDSITSIFVAFGGYAGLAAAIDVPLGTASAWKTRQSIPPEHWPAIVVAAGERAIPGVTIERLAALRAERRSQSEGVAA